MSDTAPCTRCTRPCAVRPEDPTTLPVYGLVGVRASRSAYGLCLDCAFHWWLFTVDAFRWSFADPALLRQPVMQVLILSVFDPPPPIDFGRIAVNWDLPWPKDWPLPKEGFNA